MNQQNRYRYQNTSLTAINYHFVWIPKRRKKVLVGEVAVTLEELLYEKCKELDLNILALEIGNNYVHLFVNTPPTIAPHQIMFRLKGYTSRILRKKFPHLMKLPSMWTRSYYCGTAAEMSSTTIKRYIANHKL